MKKKYLTDPNEVKSMNIIFRISPKDNEFIKKRAIEEDMTVSEYILLHSKCRIVNPEFICEMTNLCETLKKIAKEHGNDDLNDYVNKEIERLWSLLN